MAECAIVNLRCSCPCATIHHLIPLSEQSTGTYTLRHEQGQGSLLYNIGLRKRTAAIAPSAVRLDILRNATTSPYTHPAPQRKQSRASRTCRTSPHTLALSIRQDRRMLTIAKVDSLLHMLKRKLIMINRITPRVNKLVGILESRFCGRSANSFFSGCNMYVS